MRNFMMKIWEAVSVISLFGGVILLIALLSGHTQWNNWDLANKAVYISMIAIAFAVAVSRRAKYIAAGIFFLAMLLVVLFLGFIPAEKSGSTVGAIILVGALIGVPGILMLRKGFRSRRISMAAVDSMTGPEFEQFCAEILRRSGFHDVSVMGGSGDQGVDIIAKKGKNQYAIQCKCYSNKLGNTPVQEVFAGRIYYGCDVAAVMTNSYFTPGAVELAKSTGVFLWARDWIVNHLPSAKETIKTLRTKAETEDKSLVESAPEAVGHDYDELLPTAIEVVVETETASVSMLQRRLNLGYSRAARLVDQMEALGVVGPFEGSNPRQVLITKEQWQELQRRQDTFS